MSNETRHGTEPPRVGRIGEAGQDGGGAEGKPVTLTAAFSLFFQCDLDPALASRNTIDSYKTTFRLFLQFIEKARPDLLPSSTPIEHFDALLIEAFLRHLKKDRGCHPSTINVRRSAFAALARSLQRRHPDLTSYCNSLRAIRSHKSPQVLIGYFEVNEIAAIFDAIDTSTPDGFRDLVLLRCLYNTGARASELCGLRISDVRLTEPAHVVLHGKGGKSRTVPLWPVTADLVRAYLNSARRTPKAGYQDFLFVARRGNALTRQGLYKIARAYLHTAARKLPQLARQDLHPICSFRHTTATHLLMAGVSLPEIQDILGHARPETTMRYRAVSLERKRHALERLLALRNQKAGTKRLPETTDSQKLIEWLERL